VAQNKEEKKAISEVLREAIRKWQMKILVTGSAGMLGTDLCKQLAESGYFFIGTDIKESSNQRLPQEGYLQADILDAKKIESALTDIKPELVIHTAAYTAVDDCEANKELAFLINEQGTSNVAKACKKIDCPMIYISTDYVFDGKKSQPYETDDAVGPESIYGKSKLAGENVLKETLNKCIIVRTSWLYGKNGPNFVDKMISKAKEQQELKVVDDQIGSPTHTLDLSKALINICRLLENNDSTDKYYGTYHVTNSGTCSWHKYACEILKYAGLDVLIEPISTEELKVIYLKADKKYAPRPNYSVLSNNRYNETCQKPMRSWQEALRSYLNQF
jgi:dTDP-4-dehydrorhamnose reductase